MNTEGMRLLRRLGLSDVPRRAGNASYSDSQAQTRDAFAYKWAKRSGYESDVIKAATRTWLVDRYCEGDSGRIDSWLNGGRKVILDAGCGAGYSALLLFGERLRRHDYIGIDISSAIDIAEARFAEANVPGHFFQASMLEFPVPDNSIDLILAEGSLQYTDAADRAFSHLARKLRVGGRILFYFYGRKAAVREFTDDHVRSELSRLPDDQAWAQLMALTKLGVALGKLNVKIDIPEDIELLGIRKGRFDLQRFIYWNVCKMFYREDFTLDEMNLINFDWFRPLNCHRHTLDQILALCDEAGLEIEHRDSQPSGHTIVAVRGHGHGDTRARV